MLDRREFLSWIAITGAAALCSASPRVGNAKSNILSGETGLATRADETILRLGGDGGGYPMTWTSDDRQLAVVLDGSGWPESSTNWSNSRLFSVEGSPPSVEFKAVDSYPSMPMWAMVRGEVAPYFANSLAVGKIIYQLLGTTNKFTWTDKESSSDIRFCRSKLIYSPNNGETWCNQNGSSPVVWEDWESQSKDNMVFFDEPNNAFSLVSFLQMGRAYSENTDGYVYAYSSNADSTNDAYGLMLFRVPRTDVLFRGAYEYFAGLHAGDAVWVKDIRRKVPVLKFPRGHTFNFLGTEWLPSVAYNAPLGVYMMACSGRSSSAQNSLEIWISRNPWGIWTRILNEPAWMPAGDAGARAVWPQIAPKWISNDGRSFWLVWTDEQAIPAWRDAHDEERRMAVKRNDRARYETLRSEWRRMHPYFAFNVQRVELISKSDV